MGPLRDGASVRCPGYLTLSGGAGAEGPDRCGVGETGSVCAHMITDPTGCLAISSLAWADAGRLWRYDLETGVADPFGVGGQVYEAPATSTWCHAANSTTVTSR